METFNFFTTQLKDETNNDNSENVISFILIDIKQLSAVE